MTGSDHGAATPATPRLPKLPPLQPSVEYSTLRSTKQQPSARLKSWDMRKSVAPNFSATASLPMPAATTPRQHGSRLPLAYGGGFGGHSQQQMSVASAYPQSARGPRRPGDDLQTFSADKSLVSTMLPPQRSVDPDLFVLDQEELSAFNLGGSTTAGPSNSWTSAAAGSTTKGGPPGQSSEDAKEVDHIPAYLTVVRGIYISNNVRSRRGSQATPDGTSAGDVDGGDQDASMSEAGLVAAGSSRGPSAADEAGQDILGTIEADEEFDEEVLLKRELARLHTGEDVIAFFAKNGSNTHVKFVFCKRRELVDPTEFRPYDLEVIPEMMDTTKGLAYSTKLGEHFTISATGVVYVCPGQQSEYMSLGDWMHQCLMYSVLTSMNFFKYYIHGKVFSSWQKHARYTVYCHSRARLSRRLFFAKPIFVGPLVRIQALMHEVETVKVMNIGTTVYNLTDFGKEQLSVRSNPTTGAAKELELKHDGTVSVLDRLVKIVDQSTELSQRVDEPAAVRPRMKSMVQEKKEARDNARRHQLATHDQGMLGDCIRLVDYMFQSRLVKIVVHASIDFFQRVETSTKMFVIHVAFGEQHIVFNPCLDEFLKELSELWTGTIQVVNSVPSFLTVRQYDPYVTVHSTQSVESILQRNREFQQFHAAIEDKIRSDIHAAQKFSDRTFSTFRPIYDYGNAWNAEEYLATTRSNDELARDMHTMKEFQDDLEKFKTNHPVGIISVDGRNLRNALAPVPEDALAVMKSALAEIARKKCAGVLNSFDHANRLLDERPKTLSAYADYVRHYNEIRAKQESMDEHREEVENVYQLLKQYHVRSTNDDVIQLEIMNTKGNDFTHKKVIEANSFIQEKREEMVDTLTSQSATIEEHARDLLDQLKKGQFCSDESIPESGQVLEELAAIQSKLNGLQERAATFEEYQGLFNVPNSFEFVEVERTKNTFSEKHKLWTLVSEWGEKEREWKITDIKKLDVEKMNKQVVDYSKLAFQLSRSLEGDMAASTIKKKVDELKNYMPVILDLGNPAMQDRHRDKIRQAVGISNTPLNLMSLGDAQIFEKKDFVSEISGIASGEFALEQQLKKVEAAWKELPLPLMNHRNSRDLWILGDVSEIITQLEDHSVQMQTMMGSRFIQGIRTQVEGWESKIRLAADVIDEFMQVQRSWMYLESIFSAEDIQRQLPTESTKFKGVDKFWRDTFKKVRQTTNRTAMEAFQLTNLLPQLKNANNTLDAIQKSLEAYLETKRASFPRFYFLSDDELLSILSQTRNPEAVQEHLCKCFDAINRVAFTQDKKQEIIEMADMIQERVRFVEHVETHGVAVEKWLGDIEVKMVMSLRELTRLAFESYPEDGIHRKDWLFSPGTPSQTILAVDQIMWTKCAEDALDRLEDGDAEAMLENIEFTKKQLEHSVSLVRLDLTKLQRVLMGALIVLDVHGISVLENLEEAKCSSITDFDWSKQLRYYWVTEEVVTSDGSRICDDCVIRQTIASSKYSHEYLGNTPRLVVTPLTDKCYMTLTGAMHLNYGGAPAGPAGTGKTETTKDLGKALAVPVVVFNCSDGLDYKIMGRFFSGLAQAGAWACFDEFNRIQVEVLSVIAQQMLTVTQAIRAKKDTFEFLGSMIPLNRRFGVFITMNPGYAGRAELPDNLKSLFRPVAMMVPDYALIAEIMLYSEGFGNAKQLSRKMVSLYSLSSEQLSKQDHYDFGMRAVKSVLVMAGQLKRKYPGLAEDVTLIRALRDSNVPKFLSFDLPLFSGIIKDLYPEVTVPFVDYGNLQSEIESQLRIAKLQIVPAFIGKIIQLLETQLVRHGVMVVGLTLIGKSTSITILSKALSSLRKKKSKDVAHQLTKIFSLNPKSITMEELYGFSNLMTGEWTDGLVAILVREAVSQGGESKKWVVFDGPVDAIWIENMNTVLDDNKMLCLANGERIKLPPTMTMVFEVQDLKVASPATVSRCGMVYLEPVQLGWKPLIVSWAETFKEKYPNLADPLRKWTTDICDKALPFIRSECREAPGIASVDANLVGSFLRMLTTFISPRHGFRPVEDSPEEGKKDEKGEKKAAPPQGKTEKKEQALARVYCAFAAIWSLGANLHEASRDKFQAFLRGPLQSFCPETPDANLYSMCVNDEDGSFVRVTGVVPEFVYDESVPFFNILVPTSETTMQRLLAENLMHGGFHALFSGETGVGKSVGIQQFLNTAGESFSVASANFSAQTSSANVVDFLENRLERKRKNLLGAPPGTRMLLFVDDLNMPMLEKYGAQPPIELLRQVVDYKGFYDRKKLFWKAVADTQVISACGPPGGGRMEVTPRMLRHFNMIWMTALPEETMNRILDSILSGWLHVKRPELEDLSKPIVATTVDMFFRITMDLLPTPVKSHYTFNLRDPAKMLQGMLMVQVKTDLKDRDSLMRLWLHEACRQFRDRLVSVEDRTWFNDRLVEKIDEHVHAKWSVDKFENLVFGDFFDAGEKVYVASPGPGKLLEKFNDYLEEYNSTNPSKMNLVFFTDAQNHLARIARIIRQPRGNALLVGVSGVGRKSMARMAAHMASFTCSSIEITRLYGTNEFREDIKQMMMRIVKDEGKPLVFLFSDTQIVKESFLEDINNVLNTGEVPNLFAPDETEQIIGFTRPLAKAAGKVEARDAIWQHFVQLVRENLHIVLAFSPIGEGFRARCRQFPSIINCASIDWYDPWPQEALLAVADRYYREAPKGLGLDPILIQLGQVSSTIHISSKASAESFFANLRRRTYMTPTSYLELIRSFTELLGFKKGDLTTKLSRYKVGAQRLDETKSVVDKLKVDLTKMQPVIEQGKKDTAQLIIEVDREEAIAKEKAAACEVDEKEASEAAASANEIKTECQRELDEALPEYYTAIKSLDSLDKKDIQEVKSFSKPPGLVEVVLNAVCLLMGKKESWDEAKKLMNDTGFLQSLRDYDKDALAGNLKLTGKLQRYVKRDDFQPEQVKKVSGAANSLCMWVRAMDVYARVARSIEPKKEKLKGAESLLAEAEAKLNTKKAELKLVQDKVAALQLQLMRAKSKAEKLEQDAETCKVKLVRAEKLLGGLGNEAKSWEKKSMELDKNLQYVVGNITLAAGFIAYSGAFTADFRAGLVKTWLEKCREVNLAADPNWKLSEVLVDPSEVREWTIKSLPADDLSIDNAILVTRGRRWPLMVDPQGQGNRWVKHMKKDKNLGVIKLSTPNFLRALETGIREGAPILLENVEEVLDPSIEPVLTKQIFKKGGQWLLRLGVEDVPYNDDFRFYITTKMSNPHYLPEVCIKVTVINFTVTLGGLEDQLVADVVANERPDLAELRANLVVQIAADKAEMDRLEQLILKLLSEAGADLLADDTLIVTLDQSKQTSSSCLERMASADKSMEEIDEVTEKFRPVATRASIIYFVVADLANIDPMYQYSLQYFTDLFVMRLSLSEKDDDIGRRIAILLNDFTEFIYVNICRGLFEDHKLLFSFLITAQIMRHKEHSRYINKRPITPMEWSFFLRGVEAAKGVLSDDDTMEGPENFSPLMFKKLRTLELLTQSEGSEAYDGLGDSIFDARWLAYSEDDRLFEEPLPCDWEGRLTAFQRLLVVKSLREDLLQLVVRGFVSTELGDNYIVSPPFDLAGCFKDSVKTTPLIFILSSGADPTDALLKLARDQEYDERLHFISLGQGQGEKAEKLIKLGRETGDWVCLQNCHLAASWMPALERIQEQQDASAMDDMYRLWLTSMPSPTFPVPVLQSGIKITNEPPKGLRANLNRTFNDITPEVYEGCSKSREFKKLLFSLAFFHAAILERRKFGPIGWNVPYEWMDSDFQVSREQVQMYLESQHGVPWVTLNYIIAEVNYGGRVTDDKDVRLISAFLRRYFNEEVLDDGYRFSPLDAYYAPKEGNIEQVREYIRGLPMDEDPQVYGLHSNAQITAQTQSAKQFLDTIVSVQPRMSSGGGGQKPEDIAGAMTEEFLAQVPALMTSASAHKETYRKTPDGGIVSLGVFHSQEMERFNSLIACIRSTLVTLGQAIKGLVVMSAQLEEMFNSFLTQAVPPVWGEPKSYPCLKPLNAWFQDFLSRIAFMNDWLTLGPPASYWVSCFYFPQGFMTCSKQVHARKTRIPIDALAFWTEPTGIRSASEATSPEDGQNVHGLFIQGCGWTVSGRQMKESAKGVLFVELPVIWMRVIPSAELEDLKRQPGRYLCPLYKTSLRKGTLSTTGHSTNFVTFFQLPSSENDQDIGCVEE